MENGTNRAVAAGVLEAFGRGKANLVCVLGPVGSGNAARAAALAREIDSECGKNVAEIINADTPALYDLPWACEEEGIPVHLSGFLPIGGKYDRYAFRRDFEKVWSSIISKGGVPILRGGGGAFVLDAASASSLPLYAPDPLLRAELEEAEPEELREALLERRDVTDPDVLSSKKALVEALEDVFLRNDHPGETVFRSTPRRAVIVGDDIPKEDLPAIVEAYADSLIEGGLPEKVAALMGDGASASELALCGIEYKLSARLALGLADTESFRPALVKGLLSLARKQAADIARLRRSLTQA